jgi:predicted methyltransferase
MEINGMTLRNMLTATFLAATLGLGAASHADAQAALYRGARGNAVILAAAIGDKDRPASDREQDIYRKPADLLAFAGVSRGMKVADMMPGHGYFLRMFSNIVGKNGHVWAVIPKSVLAAYPKAAEGAQSVAADPAFSNVSVSITPLDKLDIPARLDLIWTSQNYHDVYNGSGPDEALKMDKAAFAALRKGGTFIVTDHVAAPGGTNDAALHRIDPAIVRQQAEAAGFVFESSSNILTNPDDSHDKPVFDPSIRKHTDQFIFKFRKPA